MNATAMGDVEALLRYAERADADAFCLLVSRYQGLVFSACRRVLGNAGEAEDAVQETFIKLARQAGSIRTNPASWIFSCALNTARDRYRAERARREREAAWAESVCVRADDARGWQELLPVIDDCIAELPDDGRELLIKTYLMRQTQEHLAAEQGISRPTLRKRLDSAVEQLREGLRRRGVTIALVALMAWLTEGACEATVPAALSQSLAKIGLAGSGHGTPASALAGAGAEPAAKTGWAALMWGGTGKAVAAAGVCAIVLVALGFAWQRLGPAKGSDERHVSRPNSRGTRLAVPAGVMPTVDPAAGGEPPVTARNAPAPAEGLTPTGQPESVAPPPPPLPAPPPPAAGGRGSREVPEALAPAPPVARPGPVDGTLPVAVQALLGQHGAVHVLFGSRQGTAAVASGLLAALPRGKAQAMAPGGPVPRTMVVVGDLAEVCFGFLREGLRDAGAMAVAEDALRQTAALLVDVDREAQGQTPYLISEADPKTGQRGKVLASIMLEDYLALYAEVQEFHPGRAE